MSSDEVTLTVADPSDYSDFKHELQESFAVAVVEAFGPLKNGPVPAATMLDKCMQGDKAVVLRILRNGDKVGGAVLKIDPSTNRNELELFFLRVGAEGKGTGLKAWKAIEQRYPETKVWRTITPYFERRNVHFYVNKCGFKVIEYWNKYHPEAHGPDDLPDNDAFLFEKVM